MNDVAKYYIFESFLYSLIFLEYFSIMYLFTTFFSSKMEKKYKKEKKQLTNGKRHGIMTMMTNPREEVDELGVDIDFLSDEIVRYRAKHNLNQGEFAQLCNLTKQTIGAIESGRHGITKLTRAKIMRVIESEE